MVVKRKKNSIGNQNQGFTLIEVMIAICVLAIIVVPTLNYFANSAKYNARSGEKHKATVAAERLIEEIKSTKQDELITNLEDPDGTITTVSSGGAFTVTSESAVNIVGHRYVCTGKVQEGNSIYDAKVEIDPGSNMVSSGASLHTINLSTDVVFDEDSFSSAAGMRSLAIDELSAPSNILHSSVTPADVQKNISKNIIFTLTKQSDTVYKVDCRVSYYVENLSSGALRNRTYYRADQVVASETIDTNSLENIYLFYQNYDYSGSDYANMNDIYFETFDASGNQIPMEAVDFSKINFYVVCQNADTMSTSLKNNIKVRLYKDESNGIDLGQLTFKNIYFNVPTDPGRVQHNKVTTTGKIYTNLTGSDQVSALSKVTVTLYKEGGMAAGKKLVTLKTEVFYATN